MRTDEKGRQLYDLVATGKDFAYELMSCCNWFTGVPDSMFKTVLPHLDPYIPAPRENHALAMAFGARLAGKRPCVLMQNSGLGQCGDVLLGMFHLYRMGVLIVVANRGDLHWEEQQHQQWGEQTLALLDALDVQDIHLVGGNPLHTKVELASAFAFHDQMPVALVVERGEIDEAE